jgi:hypothetical protein
MARFSLWSATSCAGVLLAACQRAPQGVPDAAAASAAPSASASASTAPSAEPPPPAPAPPVGSVTRLEGGPAARVVFVDQEHRCPCNAEQIDFAWSVVDRVHRSRPGLKVERVHADKYRDREGKLRSIHNFWTFPAIYVFDARGDLVALLQGKLSTANITDALQ